MPYLKVQYEKRPLQEGEDAVSLYRRLAGDYSCLLEKVNDGEMSVIGFDPFLMAVSENEVSEAVVLKNDFGFKKSRAKQILDGKQLKVLYSLIKSFELRGEQPLVFSGGMIGFFSYDFLVNFNGLTQNVHNDLGTPDYSFCFYDKAVVIDYEKNQLNLVAVGETQSACERKLKEIALSLDKPVPLKRLSEAMNKKLNVNREQYLEEIGRIKELMKQNSTEWINFSQRISADFSGEMVDIYKRLFKFLEAETQKGFLFDLNDFTAGGVMGHPLAYKRGSQIGGSNWGLIDLEKISNKNYLEYFVPNMPSTTEVGMPKNKAAEVVDLVEDFKRGVFGGAAGFVSFSGNADFYSVLKSFLYKDNRAHIHIGSWVDAKFDAENTYEILSGLVDVYLP